MKRKGCKGKGSAKCMFQNAPRFASVVLHLSNRTEMRVGASDRKNNTFFFPRSRLTRPVFLQRRNVWRNSCHAMHDTLSCPIPVVQHDYHFGILPTFTVPL